MITKEQQYQSAELIKTLAQKAWESSSFKEQLVTNPISTIESVTGQKIPESLNILVEDQTDDSIIFLNIPRKIDLGDLELELTDEQLELVSGGEAVILAACAILALVGGSFAFGYSMGKDAAQ